MTTRGQETRFRAETVAEYIDARSMLIYTGESGMPRRYIGKYRMSSNDTSALSKWRRGAIKSIAMSLVDEFLMRYDLMLQDYEQWAELNHPDYICLLNGRDA